MLAVRRISHLELSPPVAGRAQACLSEPESRTAASYVWIGGQNAIHLGLTLLLICACIHLLEARSFAQATHGQQKPGESWHFHEQPIS